jgi:hypothetical protein
MGDEIFQHFPRRDYHVEGSCGKTGNKLLARNRLIIIGMNKINVPSQENEDAMDHASNIGKPGRKAFILWLCIVIFGTGIALATETEKILTINPAPEFTPDGSSIPGIVRNGRIDEITNKGIIMGDIYRPFSSSVFFLSENGNSISRSRFKAGTMVGIRMNSKKEIIVMWIDSGTRP